jgi:aminoglycoside 2''-phosphotransferase
MAQRVIHSQHLQLIRWAHPDLEIASVLLQRGQFNDVLVINGQYVFRFPRSVEAARAIAREIVILNAIQNRVSLPVPDPKLSYIDPETHVPLFTGYELIPGSPFRGGLLSNIQRNRQLNRLAHQLASFLKELHAIPISELDCDFPVGELYGGWADFYRRVRQQLFPHMRREARRDAATHFERYLNHPERYVFEPRLRHGDFGSGNILIHADHEDIAGVLDFGSAGPGDPAQDIGALLVNYGQPFVVRMARFYPEIRPMLQRAVFYMGTYALQEALDGLRDGDQEAFEAGIARYR